MSELSKLETLFSRAGAEGRKSLSEAEVYSVLELCGLGAPAHVVVPAPLRDPSAAAAELCSRIPGEKLVLKVLSSA
ncbi:MAG TPA: hypothetical protein PK523_12115, partial [Elusimicrobiales bacterium]|nr:hypothetical protein [Elusimicrobiales bacterium]